MSEQPIRKVAHITGRSYSIRQVTHTHTPWVVRSEGLIPITPSLKALLQPFSRRSPFRSTLHHLSDTRIWIIWMPRNSTMGLHNSRICDTFRLWRRGVADMDISSGFLNGDAEDHARVDAGFPIEVMLYELSLPALDISVELKVQRVPTDWDLGNWMLGQNKEHNLVRKVRRRWFVRNLIDIPPSLNSVLA